MLLEAKSWFVCRQLYRLNIDTIVARNSFLFIQAQVLHHPQVQWTSDRPLTIYCQQIAIITPPDWIMLFEYVIRTSRGGSTTLLYSLDV